MIDIKDNINIDQLKEKVISSFDEGETLVILHNLTYATTGLAYRNIRILKFKEFLTKEAYYRLSLNGAWMRDFNNLNDLLNTLSYDPSKEIKAWNY